MIIWLSSYPKSGNTWLRSFIVSILNKKGEADINDLSLIRQYPQRKDFLNFSIDVNNVKEFSTKWIKSQDFINQDKRIKILKTHYAFCNLGPNYFTNSGNTLGVIYIVRDPRNVVTSIKNHFSKKNINEALEFICDEQKVIGYNKLNKNPKNNEIITIISSWKTHYNSWKNFGKNLLIIKYEDLLNSEKEFYKIAKYIENNLKIKIKSEDIKKAISNNTFDKLKNLERKNGFREAPVDILQKKKIDFFNLGPNNNWKKILDPLIAKKIEARFKNEMEELGYL